MEGDGVQDGDGWEVGVTMKGNMGNLCSGGNVLCTDSIHDNILVVILLKRFIRCRHLGEIG